MSDKIILPGSPPCPHCSKHEKLARDYAELNAVLLDKNRQLEFRLREIRRLLAPFKNNLLGLLDRANPN